MFTLVHEAAHTSGVAPKDFEINPHTGGRTIGSYGLINALRRGDLHPKEAIRSPDSNTYAFGFRRVGD